MLGLGPGLAIAQGRARAFDPGSLFAGGVGGIWIDPADLQTMFQDAAGTVPAAVDAPVGLIRDKSGRGNHAYQATAEFRPMLRRDAGGRHALHFDGIDDVLHHGFTVAASDVTLSCATQRTGAGGFMGVFVATPPLTRLQAGIWGQTVAPNWGTFAGGNYRSAGHDASVRAVLSVVGRAAPDTQRLFTNGARPVEFAGSYGGDAQDRRTIGREFTTLTREPYAGVVYAVLGIARALTDAELADVVRHQAAQAGVVL